MGKLGNITLNYRNMEKVVIFPKDLIDFQVVGITTTISSYGDTLVEKRDEADYILLQVEEFSNDKSDELSELYSDVTPYERLFQDTTIGSITLTYEDGTIEEIHVPYLNKTPDKLGENELLQIRNKVVDIPYYEPRKGVELEFNEEANPY